MMFALGFLCGVLSTFVAVVWYGVRLGQRMAEERRLFVSESGMVVKE